MNYETITQTTGKRNSSSFLARILTMEVAECRLLDGEQFGLQPKSMGWNAILHSGIAIVATFRSVGDNEEDLGISA